jgi:hypothetical protein
MIEHLKTYQGYCGQCGQPCTVGEYRLRGWNFVFAVCVDCLTKLTDRQKASTNANS